MGVVARSYKKMLVKKRRNAAIVKNRNRRRVMMKIRRQQRGKEDHGLEKKVCTLKSLIPSSGSDPNGIDGLFRDTADYILALQMRVRVMQMMVDALSSCNNSLE